MIYILHIDTSGNEGTISIAADGKIISKEVNLLSRDHAATINLMIEKALITAGITLNQLDGIAVCAGPGSYTGLRIGLATAKGYCYAMEKPLMLHNKLALLAHQEINAIKKEGNEFFNVAAIIPAREKEYFFGVYDNDCNVVIEPQHITEEEMIKKDVLPEGNLYITGKVFPTLLGSLSILPKGYRENEILDHNEWGKFSFEGLKTKKTNNLSSSEPFYLKQVFINKKMK
jgi:tRNA threonylcarbamoyladenosine biosynthesis protein TsaB